MTGLLRWFADPAQWTGRAGIPYRTLEHVELCVLALVCAAAIAIPLGVVLGHVRRGGTLAAATFNLGRSLPSFAIVALALPISIRLGLGLGFWPTFLAVFLLAMPPLFTNAYAGVAGVERGVVDSALGTGMRGREVLTGVELPYAAPVILASVRVAAVQVVATAPLGALVGWGGLGRFIVDGFAQLDTPQLAGGAILVALLAIATEAGFGALERLVLPEGVKRLSRADAVQRSGGAN